MRAMVALRGCGNKGWKRLALVRRVCQGAWRGRERRVGRRGRGDRSLQGRPMAYRATAAPIVIKREPIHLAGAELNPEPHVLSRAPSACFKAFPCPLPTPNSSPELRGKRFRMRIRESGKGWGYAQGQDDAGTLGSSVGSKGFRAVTCFAEQLPDDCSRGRAAAGRECTRGEHRGSKQLRAFRGPGFYFSLAAAASSL